MAKPGGGPAWRTTPNSTCRPLLLTGESTPQPWKNATAKPDDAWTTLPFDDAESSDGKAPFTGGKW